jgi:thiamine-monophosphate kinase
VDLAAKDAGKISALQHALQDGEDFELIMAVPVDDAVSMVRDQPLNKLKLTDIGHFVAEPGLWIQDKTGQKIAIEPKGFEHKFS